MYLTKFLIRTINNHYNNNYYTLVISHEPVIAVENQPITAEHHALQRMHNKFTSLTGNYVIVAI